MLSELAVAVAFVCLLAQSSPGLVFAEISSDELKGNNASLQKHTPTKADSKGGRNKSSQESPEFDDDCDCPGHLLDMAKAFGNLAITYKDEKNYENMAKYFRMLTKCRPENDYYQWEFAKYLYDIGKYNESLVEYQVYEEVLKRKSEKENDICIYIPWWLSKPRARIYKALGEYEKALQEYDNYFTNEQNPPSRYLQCDSIGEADPDEEDMAKEREEVRKLLESSN